MCDEYISPNETEGYTIIGSTTSHDGDIFFNHSNTWGNNADIWMVIIDSTGNILWEHCYGGERNEQVSNHRVIKKSDYHYIVAGESNYGYSGDVECMLMNDAIWLIELKDCDHYQTTIPTTPTGADTLCIQDSLALFTTGAVEYADHYAWLVEPEEAGTITGDSLQATYHINPGYQGTATITVKAVNDCGQSDWATPKYVQVENCTGIEDKLARGHAPLQVYPNPAHSYVIFKLPEHMPSSNLSIYNLYGQSIATLPLIHGKARWTLQDIPQGVYYYRLRIKDQSIAGKVVVQ